MEKNQLIIELEKSIKEIRSIEDKSSMMMLSIYQKSIQQIKEKKINEIKEYFEGQIKFYEQNIFNYQNEIDSIVKEYTNKIDELVKAYDYLYLNTFKGMQKAVSNQAVAIGNFVTLWNKRENRNNIDKEKITRQMFTVLQKKINYSVIVEECRARLNWCIENIQIDLNEIFENKFYQLEVYKNDFFSRIKRKISNIISGKKKVLEVFNRFNNENLENISKNNTIKIINVLAIENGVSKQISIVEEQISSQYEEALQKC